MADNNWKIFDAELAAAIEAEESRQKNHIELIASENYASAGVRALCGSVLTNKYAEGYPGKRYYGGCEEVDKAEQLAIDRACALFNTTYANVQPHSGASANAAVFQALLAPGDPFLGMSLDAGGHLTHGSPVNFSGKIYQAHHYGIHPDTGLVDYDEVREKALAVKPKLIIAGFSAYSRTLDWSIFRNIADEVGAYLLVDMAHIAGLVATGHYPSPLPHAHVVTSTTHKTLRGPRGGIILSSDKDLPKKLNNAIFPGLQGGPLMHIIAAKALAFKEAQQESFKHYQAQVIANAKTMANAFISQEVSVISGGTDNHLFLVDLRSLNQTGKFAQAHLDSLGITLNKNSIPNDPTSPFVTSGVRIGTPAITTRGFSHAHCELLGYAMIETLRDPENETIQQRTKDLVAELVGQCPVNGE